VCTIDLDVRSEFSARRQKARLKIGSCGKRGLGFKSEYLTYETHFTREELPCAIDCAYPYVKMHRGDFNKSNNVLRMCYAKWLDSLRADLHDLPRSDPAKANKRNVSMHKAISPTTGETGISVSEANHLQLKFVVTYREAARRKQKVFGKEEEAIQFARAKNPDFRHDAIQDTEAQASACMLLECTNRLNAYGKTIKDATDFFVQHLTATATKKSCTARNLVDEFIAAKQKEAASNFDLDDLRSHLTTFGERFEGEPVETITSAQIADWLRSLNVSIVTRNHYRRLVTMAFNFAVQRGYANSNPVFGRFVVSRAV